MSPEFFMAALPWISAGFSLLKGVMGFASGQENADRNEAMGKSALASGEANKARQQRINLSEEGTTQASLASQGSTFAGSPMLVYLEQVKQGALKAADFSYEGRLKKYGYDTAAADARSNAWASLFGGVGGAASALIPVFNAPKAPAPAPTRLPEIPGPWKYKPVY